MMQNPWLTEWKSAPNRGRSPCDHSLEEGGEGRYPLPALVSPEFPCGGNGGPGEEGNTPPRRSLTR